MLQTLLEQLSATHDKLDVPTKYRYRSMYEWVLKNGIQFDSMALTRSEWSIVEKNVVYTERSECFANCQQTVLSPIFPQIPDIIAGKIGVLSPFSYVEGYVLSESVPIPIHHAWLLLRGKVIDPTLRSLRKSRRKRYPGLAMGVFPDKREYYGSVISWKDVAECISRNLAWHTVLDDWKHGYPLLQEAEESGTSEPREV